MKKIKVCKNIIMKKIENIKPYRRNPRNNDKTVEFLCKIIKEVGFNVPLLIDKKNVIIKGHSRYYAAIKLNMEELPCVISNNSDEVNNKDRLTDNRASELSEWNLDELKYEIDTFNFDLEEIMFEKDSIYDFLNDSNNKSRNKEVKRSEVKKTEKYMVIKCKKCGEEIYINRGIIKYLDGINEE